jgi:XTP/dITP diphosphohydrolase
MRLLVATLNAAKRRELEALLGGLPVEVLSVQEFPAAPEVAEDADTLEENAASKASETARACGVYAVADDSGLFVEALGGRPGVHSARYAGPNPTAVKLCRKLLAEMEAVPDGRRTAHFRCCIAMAAPEGRVAITASGRVDGRILREMRGGGGFGYDPVFFYEPAGLTFAQMEPAEKNAVSHRGRALREFRRLFEQFLTANPRTDT